MEDSQVVSPRDVLLFTQPTKAFICPEVANRDYRIEFLQVKFRNLNDGLVFFESPVQAVTEGTPVQSGMFYYDLGANFLKLGSVGVSVLFHSGSKEVQRLRLIENHFFLDRHLKTYDYTFGHVQPNTANHWDLVYEFPSLNPQQEKMIVEQPFKLCADTFVFADDELIIHNKTFFRFLE